MENRVLNFIGIDRYTNSVDMQPTGKMFCGEMINIKNDGGLKVCMPYLTISNGLEWEDIFIHEGRYLGWIINETMRELHWFDKDSGDSIAKIFSIEEDKEVYSAVMYNNLIISNKSDVKNYMFTFENGGYKEFYSGIDFTPEVTVLRTFYTPEVSTEIYESQIQLHCCRWENESRLLEACQSYVNKFREENKKYTEGYFTIAINVTLYDGNEYGMFYLRSEDSKTTRDLSKANQFLFVQNYGTGAQEGYQEIPIGFDFKSFFQKFTLRIASNENLKFYKDIIKSINLYVSRPKSRIEYSVDDIKFDNINFVAQRFFPTDRDEPFDASASKITITPKSIKDRKIHNELLYKVKSWSLEEFSKGIEYDIEFGLDTITTNKTLEVSQNSYDRSGKIFVYNNRAHLYDTTNKIRLDDILKPSMLYSRQDLLKVNFNIIIKIKHDDTTLYVQKTMELPIEGEENTTLALNNLIFVNDSRAYELIITDTEDIKGTTISLYPSDAYAFSYAYPSQEEKIISTEKRQDIPENVSDTYQEKNTINVSAIGNIVSFPIEYSYKFDKEILFLSLSDLKLAENQVGQFPLYVYTSNGIFALSKSNNPLQLYDQNIPINNDIAQHTQPIYTKYGQVYIANGELFLLQGKSSIILSKPLKWVNNEYDLMKPNLLKNITQNPLNNTYDLISHEKLSQFLGVGVILSYIPNKNELIVSNKNFKYSYVYNFSNNSWHKINGIFSQLNNEILVDYQPYTNFKLSNAAVKLSNFYHEEQKQFTHYLKINFNTNQIIKAGKVALISDNKEIAVTDFTDDTPITLALSILLADTPTIDEYDGNIYSSDKSLLNKSLKISNYSLNELQTEWVWEWVYDSITIGEKGGGVPVGIGVGTERHTTFITDGDTTSSILERLSSSINESSLLVRSVVSGDIIELESISGLPLEQISITTINGNYSLFKTLSQFGYINIPTTPQKSLKSLKNALYEDDTKQVEFCLISRAFSINQPNNIYDTLVYKITARLFGILSYININQVDLLSNIYAYEVIYNTRTRQFQLAQCTQIANKSTSQTLAPRKLELKRPNNLYNEYIYIIGGRIHPKLLQIGTPILTLTK